MIERSCEGWLVKQKYGARERFSVGPVTFQHGSAANVYSGRDQAVLYGSPYGLHVSGHTHRPAQVMQAYLTSRVPLPYWHANAGCMCDWTKMHYVERLNIATWGHGLVVGECSGKIGEGRVAFHSKQWDAETRIFRMAA